MDTKDFFFFGFREEKQKVQTSKTSKTYTKLVHSDPSANQWHLEKRNASDLMIISQ
eukprot:m.219634 g.219634  ORF g.219634 m.219634 type:complete len:56 (+) comp17003_c1_seq2:528-695(+)